MEFKNSVGEYVSPQIDVMEIESLGVLCASQGLGFDDNNNSYGYQDW